MELWIRSQEKTRLVKCNNILAYQFDDETYGIQVNNDCFVGEYKTKERALEVLDEIQYLLNNNFCYSKELDQYITCNNAIYEMPKD